MKKYFLLLTILFSSSLFSQLITYTSVSESEINFKVNQKLKLNLISTIGITSLSNIRLMVKIFLTIELLDYLKTNMYLT